MSRSLKKGPYIYEKLLKKNQRSQAYGRTVVKTWTRDSQISPEMIGFTFGVHNGKDFIQVRITEDMIGHRVGREFSPTRKFVKHGGKMQKEIETKKKRVGNSIGAAAPRRRRRKIT